MNKHSNNQEPFESNNSEQSPMVTIALVTAVVGTLGLISSVF